MLLLSTLGVVMLALTPAPGRWNGHLNPIDGDRDGIGCET
jgi:hypothetical protein